MSDSDEWVDRGLTNAGANMPFLNLLPGGSEHNVENKRTGEWRKVWVNDGQTVGEAIANGQWR